MIPIYEQGDGKGIGHSLDSFLRRFDEIVQQHVRAKRAKAFALILYDFENQKLRQILKDQGVFAKLDRLSRNVLSLFYLHAGSREAIERFNETMLDSLGLAEEVSLPCVIFFRLGGETFEDIAVAELDNTDLIHGFPELYKIVEAYTNNAEINVDTRRTIKWIQGAGRFLGVEAFRAALRNWLAGLFL